MTPNAIKNAINVEVENEVRKQLGLTQWEPITDPYSALADHAGKGVALEEILHAKVEELASLKQYGGEMGDRISVIYEAWERAYSRVSANLIAIARLDLDGKIAALQARVDEQTSAIVSSALQSALSATTLEPDQSAAILTAFGQALRQPALKA